MWISLLGPFLSYWTLRPPFERINLLIFCRQRRSLFEEVLLYLNCSYSKLSWSNHQSCPAKESVPHTILVGHMHGDISQIKIIAVRNRPTRLPSISNRSQVDSHVILGLSSFSEILKASEILHDRIGLVVLFFPCSCRFLIVSPKSSPGFPALRCCKRTAVVHLGSRYLGVWDS